MIEGGFVLSANFVTLAGMILGAFTALGVALLQQNRRGDRGRDEIRDAVEAGFKASTAQADAARKAAAAAHDEVKTSNGHTLAELVEKIDADFAAHAEVDLRQLKALEEGQSALGKRLEDHIVWAEQRSAEVQPLHDAMKKAPAKRTARK